MKDAYAIHTLITWMLNAVALLVTANIIPGMILKGFGAALAASLILALANVLLLPILRILTWPITVLTLGIFWLILNGAMLKLTAVLVPGFKIVGWLPAIIGAIFLTIIQAVFRFAFNSLA